MPVYLQMGLQDQNAQSKITEKTKHDGVKQALPSAGLFGGAQMPPFHPQTAHFKTTKMPPLKMTQVQNKCISEAMATIRERHVNDRAVKRQKLLEWDCQEESNCGAEGCTQSLVDKLDASPDLAQVVASPGGLITYRNESFCRLSKESTSLCKVPLTLFELIDAEYLPQFFGMLALALHNVTSFDSVHLIGNNSGIATAAADMRDESQETSKSSHLSITLPCNKLLRSSLTSFYNITVIFMNDIGNVKRCFLGIITKEEDCCEASSSFTRCNSVVSSSSLKEHYADNDDNTENNIGNQSSNVAIPCGRILQIDDDMLFTMIKKA